MWNNVLSQCSLKRLSAPHQLPTLRIIIGIPTEVVPHPDLVVEVGILFVQFTRVVFRNWIFEKNIDFQKIKNYTKNIFSLKSSNLQSYLLTPSRNKVSSKTTVHFHSVQGVVSSRHSFKMDEKPWLFLKIVVKVVEDLETGNSPCIQCV